jgi:uncharacterized membrane protein YdbT with pleckstrin-like domain
MNYGWSDLITTCLIIVTPVLLVILFKLLAYHKTKYWITKDALYLQTGFLNTKTLVVHKADIIHINLEQTPFEKRNNAGTVIIDCGEMERIDNNESKVLYKLEALRNPVEVIRLL